MQSRKAIILLAMFIMLGLLRSAYAATAHVDRNSVAINETFTLTITVESLTISRAPSLKALEKDFNIGNTSLKSGLSLRNWKGTSKTEWITPISPKRVGTFTIPPLGVGNEKTNQLTIIVSKAPRVISTQKKEMFIEAEVDVNRLYVQQQIIYTVKYFQSDYAEIRSINHIGEKAATDKRLIVKQIDKGKQYSAEIGGKTFHVLELRFLIFPQQVGKILLASPEAIGLIRTGNRRRDVKQVRVVGENIELDVSPIPNAYSSNWWLPAKNVSISQKWSSDLSSAKVGEPITRTITIRAQGLSAEQLPELPQIDVVNARAYPDKVERETKFNGTDVVGKSINKMLIIPSGAGEVKIPETKISWWDVAQNRQRAAILPAQTINVAASAQQAKPVQPPAKIDVAAEVEPQAKEVEKDIEKQIEIITETKSRWYVELGLLLLAIITLIAWIIDHIRLKRKLTEPQTEDKNAQKKQKETKLRKNLKQACQTADSKTVRQAMLAWGSLIVEDKSSVTLLDIEQHFNDSILSNEIARLENALYGEGESGWGGANLWLAVESAVKASSQKSESKNPGLEELHKI